ncbi:MAG: SDR family NAD(P)-dependent oxidoreductase [Nitrospiria bacterium]
MRRILITGASGGLGQALCRGFSKDNVRLGLHCFQNQAAVDALRGSLENSTCDARVLRADLGKPAAVHQLFEEIRETWGGLEVLIHSAASNRNRLFCDVPSSEWEDQIQLNLSGTFYCMREAANIMHAQKNGHIINIASLAAFTGRRGQSAYTASKRGLIALSQSAAKEWGRDGIQVNVVCPGFLPTAMTAGLNTKQKKRLISENVLGHPSSLDEVSEFIRGLSKMRHVSGQVFNLDSRIQ